MTDGNSRQIPLTASQLLAIATSLQENQTTPVSPAPSTQEPLDTKWIDVVLGKDDAVRMRECGKIIKDSSKTEMEKQLAYDELEMLVEQIDNANNMTVLNLWKPVIQGLTDSNGDSKTRSLAAWVLGTAVQNNPEAQQHLLDEGGIQVLYNTLEAETDPEVRSKALYALSGLLKKNTKAKTQFDSLGGYKLVCKLLSSNTTPMDDAMRRKAMFMLKNIIIDDEATLSKLDMEALFAAIQQILTESQDQELVEKTLLLTSAILRRKSDVCTREQKRGLLEKLPLLEKRVAGDDGWNLEKEDLDDLEELLKA